MSAFDWFRRKKQNISTPTEEKKDLPKGLWHQTPTGKIIENDELKANQYVSPEDELGVKSISIFFLMKGNLRNSMQG